MAEEKKMEEKKSPPKVEAPVKAQAKEEAPQKPIHEVVGAIEAAAKGAKFPGGSGIKVTHGKMSHTLANSTQLAFGKASSPGGTTGGNKSGIRHAATPMSGGTAQAQAQAAPKTTPTQVTLEDTLIKWKLDALADSLEPLENLVIYKFAEDAKTMYLFSGSYGDEYLVCVSGSGSP